MPWDISNESFTPDELKGIDPSQQKISGAAAAEAQFLNAQQFGTTRNLYNRALLESPELQERELGQSGKISIEEANKRYGLKLAPSFAKNITTTFAEILQREQAEKEYYAARAQQGNPIAGFALGVAASLTDPIELGINLIPTTSLLRAGKGILAARAAQTLANPNAGRFAAGAASFTQSALKAVEAGATKARATKVGQAFTEGFVDNVAPNLFQAPLLYSNMAALDADTNPMDAVMDALVGTAAGTLLGGVTGTIARYLNGAGVKVDATKTLPPNVDPLAAQVHAEVNFNSGKSTDILSLVPKETKEPAQEALQNLEEALDKLSNYAETPSTPPKPPDTPPKPIVTEPLTEFSPTGFKLPRTLAGLKPRYKKHTITFASQFDQVAYTLGGDLSAGKRSNSAQKYMDFLEQNGYDVEAVAKYGREVVRPALKDLAKEAAGPETTLVLRDQSSSRSGELTDTVRKPTAPKAVEATEPVKPLSVAPGLPVPGGKRTGKFGEDRPGHTHAGIDVALPAGTPITPQIDGVVVFSGKQKGYGNVVKIKQSDGYEVLYAHNQQNNVKEGQTVKAGDTIALVGSTGRSTGPHSHIEVRDPQGRLVDPEKYFGKARPTEEPVVAKGKKGKKGKEPPAPKEEVTEEIWLDNAPEQPAEVDLALNHPKVQEVLTPLQKDILASPVSDPTLVANHVYNHIERMMELSAEMRGFDANKRREGSGSRGGSGRADYLKLQNEYLKLFDELDGVLPTNLRGKRPALNVDTKLIANSKVLKNEAWLAKVLSEFEKAGETGNLTKLVEERNQLSTALSEVASVENYTKLAKITKDARKAEATAKTQGKIANAEKWAATVAALSERLHKMDAALRNAGVDVPIDGLSVSYYAQTLGESNSALREYLALNPEQGADPIYRIKSNILEAARDKLKADLEQLDVDVSAPELFYGDVASYDDIVREYTEAGGSPDTLTALTELKTSVDGIVKHMKDMQIFSEKDFDNLTEKIKTINLETTTPEQIEFVAKQVQICALTD